MQVIREFIIPAFTQVRSIRYLPEGRIPHSLGVCVLIVSTCVAQSEGVTEPRELPWRPQIAWYSPSELGSNGPIWSVLEEPNGRLWVGADRLLTYDGGKWIPIATKTSEVRSIARRNARIWVGGLDEIGYVEENAEGEWHYTSVTSQIANPVGVVWQAFSVPEGALFICQQQVILFPDEGGPLVWELASQDRLGAAALRRGVFIQQRTSTGRRSWTFVDGTLKPEPRIDPLLNYGSMAFMDPTETGYRALAGNTLLELDSNFGVVREIAKLPREDMDALPASGAAAGGFVYLPMVLGGLQIIGPDGRLARVSTQGGLPSSGCFSIAHSRLGGFWVGTDSGLAFVQNLQLGRYFTATARVRDIHVGPGAEAYIAASSGTFRYEPHGELIRVAENSMSVAVNREGSILLGGFGSIRTADGQRWIIPGGDVLRMVANSRTGDIYLSNPSSMARLNALGEPLAKVEALQIATSLFIDKNDDLWAGTYSGGVLRFNAALEPLPGPELGRARATVASLTGDPIFLVSEAGFFTREGQKIAGTAGFTSAVGSLSASTDAWIVARRGRQTVLSSLVQSPRGIEWQPWNAPGMPDLGEVLAVERVGDSLLLGTSDGLLSLPISSLEPPLTAPPAIAEIRVRETGNKRSRSIKLNEGSTTLRLSDQEREITLIPERRPWGVREPPLLETRLSSVDDEWRAHDYGDVLVWRGLAAGEHRLEIRTRHLGVASQATRLLIVRALPWYGKPWMIGLYATVLVILFILTVRWRTGMILRRNRELERRIAERTRELAEANAAKSEFVAVMSHEIRNPLNGVIGISRMLDEAPLEGRERYLLKTLQRCAEQLRTTVDDVLDFSKIEHRDLSMNRDTFDLYETLLSTVASVDVSGEKITFELWDGPKPYVAGDQGKITQILTNYLTNALKYGVPSGAVVRVRVAPRDAAGNSVQLTVAVSNPGPQIPAAELPKLFDSFRRGQDERTRRIRGTGLGLAICRHFATAMGGSVGASSTENATTFEFSLPLEVVPDDRPAAPCIRKRLSARALAIEDEDYNRLVLGNILQKLGFEVDWAADGRTALQLVSQRAYDLVLTDWMLPDTDAGKLTPELLLLCSEPKPPVFAVTAYSTQDKKDEALDAGMAGFISKPLTLEKLEAALQQWGSQHAPRRETEQPAPLSLVTFTHLNRLGQLGEIGPRWVADLETGWKTVVANAAVDRILTANEAHRLISAALLVECAELVAQLRLLEKQLRGTTEDAVIDRQIEVTGELVERVTQAVLQAAQADQSRAPEVQ